MGEEGRRGRGGVVQTTSTTIRLRVNTAPPLFSPIVVDHNIIGRGGGGGGERRKSAGNAAERGSQPPPPERGGLIEIFPRRLSVEEEVRGEDR